MKFKEKGEFLKKKFVTLDDGTLMPYDDNDEYLEELYNEKLEEGKKKDKK